MPKFVITATVEIESSLLAASAQIAQFAPHIDALSASLKSIDSEASISTEVLRERKPRSLNKKKTQASGTDAHHNKPHAVAV